MNRRKVDRCCLFSLRWLCYIFRVVPVSVGECLFSEIYGDSAVPQLACWRAVVVCKQMLSFRSLAAAMVDNTPLAATEPQQAAPSATQPSDMNRTRSRDLVEDPRIIDEDPLLISQTLTYVTDDGSTLHTFQQAPFSFGTLRQISTWCLVLSYTDVIFRIGLSHPSCVLVLFSFQGQIRLS
jgi:hypothetical protein